MRGFLFILYCCVSRASEGIANGIEGFETALLCFLCVLQRTPRRGLALALLCSRGCGKSGKDMCFENCVHNCTLNCSEKEGLLLQQVQYELVKASLKIL